MLARLHLATPPGTTALRPFAVPGRAELDAALDDLGRPWDAGPFSEPARRALADHVEVVTQALAELDRLIDQLAAPDGRTVVTHGEPHPGNLIQTRAGLVLIDWDTVAVARPERDLWMIDDPAAAIHYRQLTGITPEPEAMAGYRLLWALTDVAAFTVELRRPHRRDADGEHRSGASAASSAERSRRRTAGPRRGGARPATLHVTLRRVRPHGVGSGRRRPGPVAPSPRRVGSRRDPVKPGWRCGRTATSARRHRRWRVQFTGACCGPRQR